MENLKSKKFPNINKTFRMEEKLVEKLQKIANKENISLNALVVQACQFVLKEYDENSEV